MKDKSFIVNNLSTILPRPTGPCERQLGAGDAAAAADVAGISISRGGLLPCVHRAVAWTSHDAATVRLEGRPLAGERFKM